MRLFQNSGLYPAYLPRLADLSRKARTFTDHREAFLEDRFGACHLLAPVLDNDPTSFVANGDHEPSQRCWAREQGMADATPLDQILLAQIEHHRTDVFYNQDPMRYGSAFVRRLPACVKASIAWRAAPSPGADFAAYDRVVCNFPTILESYRRAGWKPAWFAPAHDPLMDEYAVTANRPIDILFIGGYSRHHRKRAAILEAVASAFGDRPIVLHLDQSRLTRLAESPLGLIPGLREHRRPRSIRAVSRPPVFGRALYEAVSQARIVLNGAVDMAGADRGNMRCFEAMGCGALMVSDEGQYPPGMVEEKTHLTYRDADDAVRVLREALADEPRLRRIAADGRQMLREQYSKSRQWTAFQDIVSAI